MILGSLLETTAHADVVPPVPTTRWERDRAPNKTHIMIAGVAISAATALAGIALIRWPKQFSRRTRFCILVPLMLVTVGTAAGAVNVHHWVQADEEKWTEYDRELAGARATTRRNLQRESDRRQATLDSPDAGRLPPDTPIPPPPPKGQ